jgi:hypothetical protein
MATAQIVTAIAAAVGAAVAAISAGVAAVAVRRTRKSTGASLLYQIMGDWDTAHMRGLRKRASTKLHDTPRTFDEDAAEILNFFEALGYFVNGVKVIGLEEAWSAFADGLFLYVAACRTEIATFQARDRTLYEDLMKLEEQLVKIDARKQGIPRDQVLPSPRRVEAFLVQEMRLQIDVTPEAQGLGGRIPSSGRGLAGRLLSIFGR